MLTVRLIVGAAAFLFCACALSQEPAPGTGLKSNPQEKQAESAQQKSATDLRGTPQAPLVVNVLPSTQTDKEAAQKEADRQEKSASDWWLVRANWAIFIAMMAQLVAFSLQARRLKQTVSEMKEATKINADLVAVARDTAIRQLRAYLSVSVIKIDFIETPNLTVEMRIKNSGLTPAHSVTFAGDFVALDHPVSAKKFASDQLPPSGPRFDLSRDSYQDAHLTMDAPLTAQQIAAIHSGATGLYLFGEIRYIDAFKENRVATYRTLWDHKVGPNHGHWKMCDEGNEES